MGAQFQVSWISSARIQKLVRKFLQLPKISIDIDIDIKNVNNNHSHSIHSSTDTEVGDPFFVDTNDPKLPVYTAMHGMGSWGAELVSHSLEAYLEALSYINGISKQDFARIDPDENTITDPSALSEIEEKICSICSTDGFWQNMFEQHLEWIEEFGS